MSSKQNNKIFICIFTISVLFIFFVFSYVEKDVSYAIAVTVGIETSEVKKRPHGHVMETGEFHEELWEKFDVIAVEGNSESESKHSQTIGRTENSTEMEDIISTDNPSNSIVESEHAINIREKIEFEIEKQRKKENDGFGKTDGSTAEKLKQIRESIIKKRESMSASQADLPNETISIVIPESTTVQESSIQLETIVVNVGLKQKSSIVGSIFDFFRSIFKKLRKI